MTTDQDDAAFVSLMEMDITEGTKRTPADLGRYLELKNRYFDGKPFWRHKESQMVYRYAGLTFAATGSGRLALMVHYGPIDGKQQLEPGVLFGRQHEAFLLKFEVVVPRTVWDKQ